MKTRWITARQKDAKSIRHPMPWERGPRRELFIARRKLRAAGMSEAQVLRQSGGQLRSA